LFRQHERTDGMGAFVFGHGRHRKLIAYITDALRTGLIFLGVYLLVSDGLGIGTWVGLALNAVLVFGLGYICQR
jgi:hypothetical protein